MLIRVSTGSPAADGADSGVQPAGAVEDADGAEPPASDQGAAPGSGGRATHVCRPVSHGSAATVFAVPQPRTVDRRAPRTVAAASRSRLEPVDHVDRRRQSRRVRDAGPWPPGRRPWRSRSSSARCWSIRRSCRPRWRGSPTTPSGRSSASSAAPGCWPPRWSTPAASSGSTSRRPSTPTACGASPTSRGRWPCRSGTTTRRRSPRSAARLAHEYRVSVVDINFGCPVRQVTQKAHSGSYLLRFPERMGAIIEQVVAAAAPTPVTAKIRLGCTRDQINAIDVAQVVEGAGAAALTVHGRTAADMFSGSADWDRIAAIKPHLQADSAHRQRRPRLGREGRRRVPPLRRRRRDDRPGGAQQAVALRPGRRRRPRRAGAAGSDARRAARADAAPLRRWCGGGSATRRRRCSCESTPAATPRAAPAPASSASTWRRSPRPRSSTTSSTATFRGMNRRQRIVTDLQPRNS